jgi:putative N-acetyltransferase (TIGR04045 family)
MAEPSSRSSATASLPGRSQTAAPLLTCAAAATEAERCAHFRIRHQVFVIEQGLFGGSYGGGDADVHDGDPATIHVIGRADETICGTVRLYPLGPDAAGRWKGDRLAVLASYRHLGLGAPLVRFAVRTAGRLGGREMEAFIQPANVAFFRWLGWRRTGGLVEYAGIAHQRMVIDLAR